MRSRACSNVLAEGAPLPEAPSLSLLDLQLPEATGWWPPAPGWWLLPILLLVLALSLPYYRKWRRQPGTRQFRAAALDELAQYYQQYQHYQHYQHYQRDQGVQGDRQEDQRHASDATSQAASLFIQQTSALLKRVALIRHDPARVARLSGEGWADFLTQGQDETCRREIRALLAAGYNPRQAAVDAEPLYHFARRWIASKEAFPG